MFSLSRADHFRASFHYQEPLAGVILRLDGPLVEGGFYEGRISKALAAIAPQKAIFVAGPLPADLMVVIAAALADKTAVLAFQDGANRYHVVKSNYPYREVGSRLPLEQVVELASLGL